MDPFIFNSPSFQEFQESMPPLVELLVTKTMWYAGFYLSSKPSMLASLVICFLFTSKQEAETLSQGQSWATLSMVQAHGHTYTSHASCPKGFIVSPKCCQLGIHLQTRESLRNIHHSHHTTP